MSRLSLLHLNLIGIGTALVLAAILFFALIKPKQEEVKKVGDEATASENAGGTPTKVSGKKKDLEKTKLEVAQTKSLWEVNERKYMPTLDFQGDLLETYQNKVINIPATWGTWVTKWYDAQRNLGVARVPGVEFPVQAFPADPNYISTIQYLKFPTDRWPVTVEAKSFNAAMAHLRRFNDMQGHGMPVINNVALEGQSPTLLLTYDLALYVIPGKTPPSADPILTRAAGGAGGGMMGGSMMGSMMSGAMMGSGPQRAGVSSRPAASGGGSGRGGGGAGAAE